MFSHSVMSNSLWPHGLQHTMLPVLHHLPELAQTHVHWVRDAIQPPSPLTSPLLLPSIFLSSAQFSHSVMSGFLYPNGLQHARPSLSITRVHSNSCPSNHLILCSPLLLPPSIFPSIRFFSNESALHIRWRKYWSFSFNISPSNEHPGLFSFRMDWLDLLAVQGTLKSLLQHHSSKASILRRSAFFTVHVTYIKYVGICQAQGGNTTWAPFLIKLLCNCLKGRWKNLLPQERELK